MSASDKESGQANFSSMEESTAGDWNRDMREMFRDSPWFAQTEEFCARYDGPAFDVDAEFRPLEFFEPMLRRVFAQPRNSIYRAAIE